MPISQGCARTFAPPAPIAKPTGRKNSASAERDRSGHRRPRWQPSAASLMSTRFRRAAGLCQHGRFRRRLVRRASRRLLDAYWASATRASPQSFGLQFWLRARCRAWTCRRVRRPPRKACRRRYGAVWRRCRGSKTAAIVTARRRSLALQPYRNAVSCALRVSGRVEATIRAIPPGTGFVKNRRRRHGEAPGCFREPTVEAFPVAQARAG